MTAHKVRQLKSVLGLSILTLLLVLSVFAAVRLLLPANNAFTNGSNNSIRFAYNYTGSVGNRTTCKLYIDSKDSGWNKTGAQNVNRNFSIRANASARLPEGARHWNVTCTNLTGGKNSSVTRLLTIDRTRPTITLNYPSNGYNTSNTRLDLNWTASDNLAKTFKCNLTTSLVINRSVVVTNNSLNNVTLTFGAGRKSWSVLCKDNTTTNNRQTQTRNFTIDNVKPLVFGVKPTSNFRYNVTFNTTNKIQIRANFSDALSNISAITANITWPGPNVRQLTLSRATGGPINIFNNTFTVKNLSRTRYNVSFRGTDVVGNVNKTVTTFFTVNDSTAPSSTVVATSSISGTGATVTWTSDEIANGTITYGTLKSFGSSSASSTQSTTHSISLTGLNWATLYYFNVSACDTSGNCRVAANGPFNFTTLSVSGGSSGGGGGGGSGGSVITAQDLALFAPAGNGVSTVQTVAKIFDSLDTTTPATFNVDATKIPVVQVAFTVNKKLYGSSIKVNLLSGKPSDTSDVPGKVNNYIEIVKGTLSNSDIITATIGFKVAKSWLSSNSFSQTDMNMYRFVGTDWQKLPTSVVKEDSDYVYYTSSTPGFSFFAIVASPQPAPAPVVSAPAVSAPAPVVSAPAPAQPTKNNNLLWGIAALVVIALLYSTLFKKKSKHSKFY